jgi:hypothetical protein
MHPQIWTQPVELGLPVTFLKVVQDVEGKYGTDPSFPILELLSPLYPDQNSGQ